MMNVKPLHNEQDYEWAISEVTRYFESQPRPGTEEGDRFEVLATLIKEYEDEHFEIPKGDPVDILKFAIESMGRSQADLAKLIGRNRASEILNRVRPLNLDMIRSISAAWHIPTDLLISRYDVTRGYG
ncbi:MAG: XRE family transcriptional regulator [Hyphomicrobiales bacterium]|nr:XRE family transcriptional regulator [Hyphomicrobiales bacterium]MBV9113351.1 XRE family transcriptional regulator [Hyphomicrobiales bacterium]MBV9518665.1 XRE family transcriptional regulator [Hyphomicrobiales bacterium]